MQAAEAILDYLKNTYQPEEFPALSYQMREWSKTRPLQGLKILDATPLFANTLLKYVSLLSAGAEVISAIHDNIPYDPSLPELLQKWRLPCVYNTQSGSYDCILDCGGVHNHLVPKYGFVELTRSGYYHYTHATKPVILVDDSHIKVIETCLGTGDGFLRGMKESGYNDFRNRSVAIFGFGKVGRGIAYYAHREGAEITVVDEPDAAVPDYIKLISRYDKSAIQQTIRNAWCVVTATGVFNAMQGNGAAEILSKPDSRQIIAAMGIENEWGDTLPQGRVLNHGQPLNFMLKEPTRLRYIDPTMALSNAAVLELTANALPPGIQKIRSEIETFYWEITKQCGLIAEELKESDL